MPFQPRALIVDHEEPARELLSNRLRLEGYRCETADSARKALHRLSVSSYDLVIADMGTPVADGMDLLRKARTLHPDTAVVMVTGMNDTSNAIEALKLGANDYILKPFNLDAVVINLRSTLQKHTLVLENKRYQAMLEQMVELRTQALNHALHRLQETYEMTLEVLVTALDVREHETHSHSQRVREYTSRLAREMGVTGVQLDAIGRGALLHDIGKIGISDAILLKPARLTSEEWVEMRKHPQIGYEMLRNIRFLEDAAEIVLTHQERFDGTGYPHGRKKKEIPLGSRIFAVVDTLDCMTSDRPYRRAQPYSKAREEIQRCSGEQFDPDVVEAFLRISEDEWRTIRELVRKRKA